MSARKCVVLVAVGGAIDAQCEASLRVLEERGYTVRRVPGSAAIDVTRSQMATDVLMEGFDDLMWIDSDVRFEPDAVDLLRQHELDMVCAIYPKKGSGALASNALDETTELMFGKQGGLHKIKYAATGFLLTRRGVYESIERGARLPTCNREFDRPLVPYFMPMILETAKGPRYLAEDFAFSERASQVGFEIWADTSIRLWHVGQYAYSWEDAGADVKRFASYRFTLTKS